MTTKQLEKAIKANQVNSEDIIEDLKEVLLEANPNTDSINLDLLLTEGYATVYHNSQKGVTVEDVTNCLKKLLKETNHE